MITSPEDFDVLVVGAGQTGLAIGHQLARQGCRFEIIDAAPEIGHSWRTRWDSLRLFSPAEYDALPGLPFPAPAGCHPGKDQVADYLRDYAEHFDLPVRLSTPVIGLRRDAGGFTVSTPTGTRRARQVVVATGPFQKPYLPDLCADVADGVRQLHSADYRNPEQIPPGARVLVVGGANSGLQIAAELAATNPTTVAVGSSSPELPQRILGRDLFHWLNKARFFALPADSRWGRRLRSRGDLVIGTRSSQLRRRGVRFVQRLTGFTGRTASFADGTTAEVDAVVWATGYRADYSWLHVPGVVDHGVVRHRAGVTEVPGLYFLGLAWQTSRGSGLLGFVGRDAAALAEQIARQTFVPDSEPIR